MFLLKEDTVFYDVHSLALKAKLINPQLSTPFQVVKIQHLPRAPTALLTRKIQILKEFELTQSLPHLNALAPLEDAHSHNAFSFMDFIKGSDLFTICEKDINTTSKLTMDNRINIALAVLKAYKTQVHDRGIIHADLKTENMRINQINDKYFVYIIDYGNAHEKDATEPVLRGTLNYSPLEQQLGITDNLSFKSDIFSLGRILTVLMHPNMDEFTKAQDLKFISKRLANPQILEACKEIPMLDLFFADSSNKTLKEEVAWLMFLTVESIMIPLFSGIKLDDLRDEHRAGIEGIISQMVSRNMTQRPDILEVIELFEKILNERTFGILTQSELRMHRESPFEVNTPFFNRAAEEAHLKFFHPAVDSMKGAAFKEKNESIDLEMGLAKQVKEFKF